MEKTIAAATIGGIVGFLLGEAKISPKTILFWTIAIATVTANIFLAQ